MKVPTEFTTFISNLVSVPKQAEFIFRFLMAALIIVLMVGLLAFPIPGRDQLQIEEGKVAPRDIFSQRPISYDSQIRTDEVGERQAQAVLTQYDNEERRIRRQQVERAHQILEFVSVVRDDPYATPELQNDYLFAIQDLSLSPESTIAILGMPNENWAMAVREIPTALDRAMREDIYDYSLVTIRSRAMSYIEIDGEDGVIDEEVAQVVEEFVKELIQPNYIRNQERTEQMRAEARSNVDPQNVTLEQGEVILRAGEVVGPEDVEVLQALGRLQSEWSWSDVARALLFTLLLMALVVLAALRLQPQILYDLQTLGLITAIIALWLITAKIMIINQPWLPYLYPIAAFSMMLLLFMELRVAIIFLAALILVVYYLDMTNVPLLPYMTIGPLLGSIVLGKAERPVAFLWSAVAIMLGNLFARMTFDLSAPTNLVWFAWIALLNGGLAAGLALISYLVLGNLFGIITSLQLTELSRPTHPLLRQLLMKSSGTYHHTIVVSNLAERAAESIGADAFLARVGAYYHDIGKTVRPYFFAENILDGESPHDKLDPETSAQIIISHVTDGLDLAQKYRLPPRIQDCIREHHGSALVKYFYIQAQNDAPEGVEIDAEKYRYPGPSPQSKETAILLLADTCEAAVRAIRPESKEALAALIERLINDRLSDGDLDECDLTFKELQTVKGVFLHVLLGMHHPRVSYPESDQDKAPTPSTSDTKSEHPIESHSAIKEIDLSEVKSIDEFDQIGDDYSEDTDDFLLIDDRVDAGVELISE